MKKRWTLTARLVKSKELDYDFYAVCIMQNGKVLDTQGEHGVRDAGVELFTSFTIPVELVPALREVLDGMALHYG